MSLVERIDQDLMAARRRRDEVGLAALGMLKSEVVNAGKEPGAGGAVDDQTVLRVIRREVKRRQEAVDAYTAAGRAASAERERAEADVLRAYLPAALRDEELEREVRAVIDDLGAQGPRDMGRVMKEASARLAGRTEGGRIAEVARRLLAAS